MDKPTDNSPEWWQVFHGQKLVGSQRRGILMQQQVLAPMQAMIALVSGECSGDLNALHNAFSKLRRNLPVVCEGCKRNIHPSEEKLPQPKDVVETLSIASQIHFRHASNCELARMARKVLGVVEDDPLKPSEA